MIKQFLHYAIPSALAMFVSSLYTIVDGIFVGQGVGDSALAAVTIVLPLTIMLFGIATMFAVGGGTLVSKNFGSGNDNKSIDIFRQVFKLLIIVSTIISLILIIFSNPIVKLLGATENLNSLASDYLRFYAIFSMPNLIGITLNSFVRNDGNPKLAMISTISGAITNIILDYISIFPLGMGIKGAAIATGLGQLVTVSIVLPHFLGKKGKLSFGKTKFKIKYIKEFISIGIPSFFSEATFSLIILFQNIALVYFIGELGLSAFSVINYITTNIYMILVGLTFGAQPLLSYNYGAKNKAKIIEVYKITISSSLIVTFVFSLICLLFGRNLISIFTSDLVISDMAYIGLNLTNLAFFAIGLNLITTVFYQTVDAPKYSSLICCFRCIVFLPITLIILANLFGLNGIWLALLVSELLTFVSINIISSVKSYTNQIFSVNNANNKYITVESILNN